MEKNETGWIFSAGNLELLISKTNGCLCKASVFRNGEKKLWVEREGDVTVHDDLLGLTIGKSQLDNVKFEEKDGTLLIFKTFKNMPWKLQECYSIENDSIAWKASLSMEYGDFRSCAISWDLPWPMPMFSIKVWAPTDKLPEYVCRFSDISFEYGESTSGTLMPMMSCYNEGQDTGLLLSMPFDFITPRMRYIMGFRDPVLHAEFGWMALSPKHTPKASLLLAGTPGDWRPALGWAYNRYTEYFEPEAPIIDKLWGGHISGNFTLTDAEAKDMASLGMKWYEIHQHFPAYGNYHPEGISEWRSGHALKDTRLISVDKIHETIKTLHDNGIAAMPYIQVTGDGDKNKLAPDMYSACVKNRIGQQWESWPGSWQMTANFNLPFDKDITRQIDGMADRYPDMDGVFLDQACYNFIDMAHHDGITAIDNKPASMTGMAYNHHIDHLAARLHPDKAIIANGPFGIGIYKHIDAMMAEGSGWLCEKQQFFGIGTKPMFFLVYECDDTYIEIMFQSALLFGGGFASYPSAMPSKDLFDKYIPLLEKLYRRRWIFDPKPITLPIDYKGNIFRARDGKTLLVPIVKSMARLPRDNAKEAPISIKTSDSKLVTKAVLNQPGLPPQNLQFDKNEDGTVSFTMPIDFVAGLVELN